MSSNVFAGSRGAVGECDFCGERKRVVRITATYRSRDFVAQVCRRDARYHAPDGGATPTERAWFLQVCGEYRTAMLLDVPGRHAGASK